MSARAAASLDCECLVVGSGAGGALTASRLAARGRDVLLVEEGPDPDELPAGAGIAAAMPFLWREGGVVPILSNAALAFAEGRCLGGSTVINSGLVHRTPDAVVARWAREAGIAGLDPAALARHHEELERALGVHVEDESRNPVSAALREGARRCGLEARPTPVAATTVEGRRRKNDARRVFVADAERRGARVLTRCAARRIVWSGATAVALEAVVRDREGPPRPLRIRFRSLFVCGGAIQTPLLLRRSGVRRNVGDALRLHPMLRVVAEFDGPIDAHLAPMSSQQVETAIPGVKLGASVTAPAYLAASLATGWPGSRARLGDLRRMASFYVSCASEAVGVVRPLPLLPSSYVARYRVDPAACRDLGLGLARLADVLFAAGARRLYPAVEGVAPLADPAAAAALARVPIAPGRLSLTAVHALGSCPMGSDARRSAVDPAGRLHGARNVFVHDASVLPSSPQVNPQGPVMAMTLRSLEENPA